KANLAVAKRLRAVTKNAERRSRLQGMNESSANELFVWGKKRKLAVHESKELFLEGRFSQTWIVSDGRHGLINFLLEEIERDVFLGPEIVEDGAFGDSRFARNLFGSRRVEAFCLKQIQ